MQFSVMDLCCLLVHVFADRSTCIDLDGRLQTWALFLCIKAVDVSLMPFLFTFIMFDEYESERSWYFFSLLYGLVDRALLSVMFSSLFNLCEFGQIENKTIILRCKPKQTGGLGSLQIKL